MITTTKVPGVGRPSKFSQELAERVCQALIAGKSLNQVGGSEGMPTKRTIINWLHDPAKKSFLSQYKRAREIQARMLDNGIVNVDVPAESNTLTTKRLNAPGKLY